jgi:hypothetical protein
MIGEELWCKFFGRVQGEANEERCGNDDQKRAIRDGRSGEDVERGLEDFVGNFQGTDVGRILVFGGD